MEPRDWNLGSLRYTVQPREVEPISANKGLTIPRPNLPSIKCLFLLWPPIAISVVSRLVRPGAAGFRQTALSRETLSARWGCHPRRCNEGVQMRFPSRFVTLLHTLPSPQVMSTVTTGPLTAAGEFTAPVDARRATLRCQCPLGLDHASMHERGEVDGALPWILEHPGSAHIGSWTSLGPLSLCPHTSNAVRVCAASEIQDAE